MRSTKSLLKSVGSRANDQVFADDPAAHMPIDHEGQSAKHPLLFDGVLTAEKRTKSPS